MIWNREAETLPRERLQAVQLDRLRRTIERQLTSVPARAEALQAAGVQSAQDTTACGSGASAA